MNTYLFVGPGFRVSEAASENFTQPMKQANNVQELNGSVL